MLDSWTAAFMVVAIFSFALMVNLPQYRPATRRERNRAILIGVICALLWHTIVGLIEFAWHAGRPAALGPF